MWSYVYIIPLLLVVIFRHFHDVKSKEVNEPLYWRSRQSLADTRLDQPGSVRWQHFLAPQNIFLAKLRSQATRPTLVAGAVYGTLAQTNMFQPVKRPHFLEQLMNLLAPLFYRKHQGFRVCCKFYSRNE